MQIKIDIEYDSILKDYLINKYSKKYVRYLKHQEAVYKINGVISFLYKEVKKGDVLLIDFTPKTNKDEMEYDLDLDIVYSSDDFMVINKPRGLNTTPSKRSGNVSLYNAVYTYLKRINKLNTIHIITRLDKETSGLVLIALNKETALFMNKNHDHMNKLYYAKVEGIFKEDHLIIEDKILKVEGTMKRIVSNEGQYCKTEVFKEKQYEDSTLLRVKLYTGRTHQIRVHLSNIGYPIIGDSLYSSSSGIMNLCCFQISFTSRDLKEYTFKITPNWI